MPSPSATPTPITPPRVPLIDERTGLIDRAWYLFFLSLFRAAETAYDATLGPSAESLIASYDAALQALAQATETQPTSGVAELTQEVCDLRQEVQTQPALGVNELAQEIRNLRQEVQTQPRVQLGTLAALQQDNVPWLQFDTTPTGYPTGPTAHGTLYWDDADRSKTLALVMEDTGNVIQDIGEETFYRVKATATITKGQVLMFTGTVGASGGLKAAPATGLTSVQSEYILGIATQDIATNGWGYATWFGEVDKVNTTGGAEAWVDGEILYYNPAVAGGLTKFVPTAPNPKVIVASVVHAATNGILFVRPTFGSALGATDSNVEITSLTNNDLLVYDSTDTRWENKNVTTTFNLPALSANGVLYLNGSKVATSGSELTFNGSVFQLSVSGTQSTSRVLASAGQTATFQVGGNGNSGGATSVDLVQDGSSVGYLFNRSNAPLVFGTNNNEKARITAAGSVVAGAQFALATTATDGFLYVPTCAGTPTGTPTAITGMAPIVVDTTNNKLYFYSGGAWRDAGP